MSSFKEDFFYDKTNKQKGYMMDVLFINPGSGKDVYQSLSTDYSGIGTPYWALLLSQSCRSQGYDVEIIDILAERLSIEDSIKRIKNINDSKLLEEYYCYIVREMEKRLLMQHYNNDSIIN